MKTNTDVTMKCQHRALHRTRVRLLALAVGLSVLFTAVWHQALLAAPAMATQPSARTQLERFVKQYAWAQGQFDQAVLSPQGALVQRGSGTFAFARPGRFRWDTQKPYPQLVVSDGKVLTVFDPDLQQATQRPLAQASRNGAAAGTHAAEANASLQAALEGTPAALLFGAVNVQAVFELQEEGMRDGLQWLQARPRQAENLFTRMRIGFNTQGLPQRLDIDDALGQTTRLELKAWRFEKPKAEAFVFQAPVGVDVVPMQ